MNFLQENAKIMTKMYNEGNYQFNGLLEHKTDKDNAFAYMLGYKKAIEDMNSNGEYAIVEFGKIKK